jgi:hypothetical protein
VEIKPSASKKRKLKEQNLVMHKFEYLCTGLFVGFSLFKMLLAELANMIRSPLLEDSSSLSSYM